MDQKDMVLFLAVKNEASEGIDRIRPALDQMGLTALADIEYRDSCLAVIHNGEILTQKKDHGDKPIYVNGDMSTEEGYALSYEILSGGFDAGNKASIIIGETDYSPNSRGVNLVVWDLKHDIPADVIAFDTHEVPQVSELIRE